MEKAFNVKKYLKLQSAEILKRAKKFDNKLYLEFGGKLFDEFHASRVLPGFAPDSKLEVLKCLKDKLEIIFCINADDIEKKKIRADHGITYDMEVVRLISVLDEMGIAINSVVITQYTGQELAKVFKNKLERNNIKTYIHTHTKGYPTDVDTIVSDVGYGANSYIETTKPLVVITAPGPKSGKLGTCLSQLYHEYKRGVKAGYVKYETFPVWNLPLKHPVNVAYEAATADIGDKTMIDYFHFIQYQKNAVNYNRDIEVFPILKNILEKIMGKCPYNSPTDMGVNMIGFCLDKKDVIEQAARNEIIRRYYKYLCDYKEGLIDESIPEQIKLLMNELNIGLEERGVIKAAMDKYEEHNLPTFAIALNKRKIITGRQTDIMSAPTSAFINAIKYYAKISDEIHLLSPKVLEPMLGVKKEIFNEKNPRLNLQDVLVGLSLTALTNPTVEVALSNIKKLKGLDAHSSFIISSADQTILRNLGINYTSEPEFYLNNIYLEN